MATRRSKSERTRDPKLLASLVLTNQTTLSTCPLYTIFFSFTSTVVLLATRESG